MDKLLNALTKTFQGFWVILCSNWINCINCTKQQALLVNGGHPYSLQMGNRKPIGAYAIPKMHLHDVGAAWVRATFFCRSHDAWATAHVAYIKNWHCLQNKCFAFTFMVFVSTPVNIWHFMLNTEMKFYCKITARLDSGLVLIKHHSCQIHISSVGQVTNGN